MSRHPTTVGTDIHLVPRFDRFLVLVPVAVSYMTLHEGSARFPSRQYSILWLFGMRVAIWRCERIVINSNMGPRT